MTRRFRISYNYVGNFFNGNSTTEISTNFYARASWHQGHRSVVPRGRRCITFNQGALIKEHRSMEQKYGTLKKSLFPFKSNEIWLWWQVFFRFWIKSNSIWFKIENKTVTATISHSIRKEMEIKFSQRYLQSCSLVNPLMPNGVFNICCPRDCVSRHNGGTSGAPIMPTKRTSVLF